MKKKLKVDDLDIFYREEGSGDPIVILHGWGSSSNSWVRVQQELASAGFRVIVLDLPGFGQSQEPPSSWNIEHYVKFVDAFANKLDLAYFTLLGHSFGGRIAILYANRYRKKLNALVLVAAAGIIRHKKLKIKLFKIATKIGDAIFSVPPLSFLRNFTERVWYKLSGEKDYRTSSPTMKRVMEKVLDKELYTYLPAITTPTLILWGDKDTATPLKDAFVIHKSIPVTHLHILPDMPHALNLKAPKEVAKQVSIFLKHT